MTLPRALLLAAIVLVALARAAGAQGVTTQCIVNVSARGTSDAITSAALPCGTTTNLVLLTAASANVTTAPTYQPLGSPALPITRASGAALSLSDLLPNYVAMLVSTGTSWVLLNPANGTPGPAGPSGVQANAVTGNIASGINNFNPANSSFANLWNSAFGVNALTGANGPNVSTNTAVGYNALTTLAAAGGYGNTAVGYNALDATNGSTAAFNTAVGSNAGRCNTNGMGGTFVGHGAGGQDDFVPATCIGSDTTAIGAWSGQELTTGGGNTLLGMNAGLDLTTGQSNTYVGLGAGACTSNGTATAIGCSASYNTAVGYDAGQVFAGSGLVAMGYNAGKSMTGGTGNTALGYTALGADVSDGYNTAVGYGALFTLNGGSGNTAVGYNSLTLATNASGDTGVGVNALAQVTSGGANVGVGQQTGYATVAGTGNVYLGYQAGLTGDYTGSVVIGASTSASASHQVVLGDGGVTSFKLGPATGVSCSAGTVNAGTMVVFNGIVTHC